MSPQPRYSEDIDLVQITSGPIKETYDHIRDALSFLGEPKVKQNKNNNTLIYRLTSDTIPRVPIRLKVEINCKEHFSVYPMRIIPFQVENDWYTGECEILTYELEELAGTKLRALYQRRKGRDLFDLYKILSKNDVDDNKILECYHKYMAFVVDHIPTKKEFLINMEEKIQDTDFLGDTSQLLRFDENYDPIKAYELVKSRLINKL